MGRLSTQSRLLLLTGLMVGAFLLGFLTLVQYDNQQADSLLSDRAVEKRALLSQLMDIYSKPLHTLAYDYSYWDELIEFVHHADPQWGEENIRASLATYGAHAGWVFDANEKLVYQTVSDSTGDVFADDALVWMIQRSFQADWFSHFYLLKAEGLVEIYTAPIQPSNDNARQTKPQGIFAVARLWDSALVDQFETALGGHAEITSPQQESELIRQMRQSEPGVICVEQVMQGWDGKNVAVLHVGVTSQLYQTFVAIQRTRFTYVAIFSLAIVIFLAFALRKWVALPLKAIMHGLEQNSGVAFDQLQKGGAEFQQIGAIVTNFFTQRNQLWDEVAERKRAEEALRISEHNLASDLEAMTRLQNIGTRYLGNEEQQLVLNEIVDTAVQIAQADFGCLLLSEEGGQESIVIAHRSAVADALDPASGDMKMRCRLSDKFLNGERLVISDIDHQPDLAGTQFLGLLKAHGVRSLCVTPLVSRSGRTIGLLNVYYRSQMAIGERALRLIDLLCRQTTDIIEQDRSEMDLRDREGLLKATLESTADGILVVDSAGRVTHWNARFPVIWKLPPEMMEMRDDDELLKAVLRQLHEPDQFISKVMQLYGSHEESFDTLHFKDGRVFERFSCPLIREGTVTGRVWSFRDVTERHKSEAARVQLQESLEKAQRMESLGLLAGGVAHDLNNTLGPVVGFSELLMGEFPEDSKVGIRLAKISRAAKDAAVVIQDLLTLARRGRYEMQPIDINQLIQEYLNSPAFSNLKEVHPHVAFQVSLADRIGAVLGSGVHLGKAIMNLITNGCEAMPNGGKLTVRTEMRHVDRLPMGTGEFSPGEYVVVSVKDTGSGIAPEDLEKIFEPYFSKKHLGRSGSGLGLSVVYGVVKDHRGYYNVLSRVGEGTEFILYFPIHGIALPVVAKTRAEMKRGTETVLVIDDNAVQREMASDILGSLGYTVHVAENGHQGVDFLTEHAADLVLIDMIMEPEFDGLDTFRAILTEKPHQKAIIVSGFSATERVQETIDLGAGGYLKKPYHIGELASVCRRVLDGEQVVVPAQL